MSDWTEIEKLQADFQRTQLSITTQKLSERNCIEILSKLQEMKLLDVLHSMDGKEYLTPKHLAREIRDELYVHGGRVNLVEIQQSLNVDFSHVEAKANEIVKSDRHLQMVCGQMIQSEYLDQLAEDINDTLQSLGQLTIAEISKNYDLPGDFIVPELISRFGKVIDGQIDEVNRDAIFTKSFIARHKARIRGVLSAVTRPMMLSAFITGHDLSLKLLFSIVDELIAEGRIKGQIVGGRSEKSTFLPAIHTQTQNQWIDSFYSQNNYIEYDAVARLGISEPQSYLKRRFGSSKHNMLFLNTLCVGEMLVDRVVASVDETLTDGEWFDITTLLPTSFSEDDCSQLLLHIRQTGKKDKTLVDFQIIAKVYVVNTKFVESCKKYFDGLMKTKANQEAKKASVFALTEDERKEFSNYNAGESSRKADKRDDRRKKAQEGSGSTKRDFGGSGVGSREVKTKGKDKKRLKWKKEQEEMVEKNPKSRQNQDEVLFMDVDEICDVLQKNLLDCPENLLEEIAEQLQKPLQQSFQTMLKSVFLLTTQQHKEKDKTTKETSEKSSSQSDATPSSGIRSRKQFEEEINTMWASARLSAEAIKVFPDNTDTPVSLTKHLLKTICTDLTNIIFLMTAHEFLPAIEIESEMSQEIRLKLLSRFPENVKTPLTQLHNSLNSKTLESFEESLDLASDRNACSFKLKSADKKKDRQFIHTHKISLLNKLETENDPAMALHLCCSIIFQNVTGYMIHTPGKCVPDILNHLSRTIDKEVHSVIQQYLEMIMKLTMEQNKSCKDESEIQSIQSRLSEGLPAIRKLATTKKKSTAS
uniref:E3 UFM1-protein ligase 1 n=1 Tax=Phallusia mammillata TaxID=59560 RepID=A0A6F9DWE2_9ASCI|nr:E3 UFM1-protein ligase 1 [Phallusia mammillata]